MAKTLNFNYNGKGYTLEFTRETVRQMEREGFVASDINDKPMLTLPALFRGAFLAHHRYDTKQKLIDEIYANMTNKGELIGLLAEMYAEPIETLLEDPAEDSTGKISWTKGW